MTDTVLALNARFCSVDSTEFGRDLQLSDLGQIPRREATNARGAAVGCRDVGESGHGRQDVLDRLRYGSHGLS